MNDVEAAEKQFQVLDHMPVGICVIRSDYTVLFWNTCIQSRTRILKKEIVGKPIANVFPHFSHPKYKARIDTIFSGGPPAIFSSQLHGNIFPSPLRDGGFRTHHTTATKIPARETGDYWVLLVSEDVTDLTRRNQEYREIRDRALRQANEIQTREKELQKANEKLEKANQTIREQQKIVIEEERLKILLQMAGATAHEINQPLMALLGNIELMELSKDNPDALAEHFMAVKEAGKRISRIANEIQSIRHAEVTPSSGSPRMLKIDQDLTILVIEDSQEDFDTLRRFMEPQKSLRIIHAEDIPQAFEILGKNDPVDMVILDYRLPSGTGMDFLQAMEKKGIHTPAAMVTGQGDEMIASRVIQSGAYDYLPKSQLNPLSVSRLILNTLEKHRLKKEINAAMGKMAQMSTRDELTDLFNRRYFMETLEKEIARAERNHTDLALCMVDLDHFKDINDTYGHIAGDDILKKVAQTLSRQSRKYDIPCRYGGEEFAVIIPSTSIQDAAILCERMRQAIGDTTISHDRHILQVTASMGLARYHKEEAPTVEHMLKNADTALYLAKKSGRNQACVFAR